MENRQLYAIALVVASVVGGFYYYSGHRNELQSSQGQELQSNATNIKVTQTNDNGQLYAKTSASHMTQWMNSGRAEIDKIQGIVYQQNQANATFHADKAIANNDENVELTGNVRFSKLKAPDGVSMSFETQQLIGNTKNNQIRTDQRVVVSTPQAQFISQGLTANLATGQYEFSSIRGRYEPASQ